MQKRRFSKLSTYYLIFLILLYLPIAVLFLFSINDGTALTFPLRGLTLHWYHDILDNSELINALRNSIVLAVRSSLMATTLGTVASIALVRFRFRGRNIFLAIARMPLLVPFLILAGALLI